MLKYHLKIEGITYLFLGGGIGARPVIIEWYGGGGGGKPEPVEDGGVPAPFLPLGGKGMRSDDGIERLSSKTDEDREERLEKREKMNEQFSHKCSQLK